MTIGIVAIVTIGAAIAIPWLAAGPASTRALARTRRRRERRVHRNPTRATFCDLEQVLNHDLPVEVTEEICRLAKTRDVPADTLWSWAESHSSTLLALALGAGYDRGDLAQSKRAGSHLDQESLEMHAELNRSPIGPMLGRANHHIAMSKS